MPNNTWMKIMLVLAVGALTGCEANDVQDSGTDRDIRVRGEVNVSVTRATATEPLYDEAKCYVWADETNPATTDVVNADYVMAWQLTANPMGILDPGTSNKRVYPLVNWMNLYGLVGNIVPAIAKSTTPFPTEALTHQIADDQTTEAKYNATDLLYGSAYDVKPEKWAVLTFYHMLAQIQLALVPAGYLTKADVAAATVELLDMPTTVSFTPAKLSATDMGDATKRGLMVEAGTEKANIKMSAAANEYGASDNYTFATAIVAPQTLSKGSMFIKVSCKGNDYYYEIPEDRKLESGKSYRYVLALTDGTLKLVQLTDYRTDTEGGYDWDLFWLDKTPDYESDPSNPEGFAD